MVNSKVNLALCLWEEIGIYKARYVKMISLDSSSMLIYLQEGQVR